VGERNNGRLVHQGMGISLGNPQARGWGGPRFMFIDSGSAACDELPTETAFSHKFETLHSTGDAEKNKNNSPMIYKKSYTENRQQTFLTGIFFHRILRRLNRSPVGCVFAALLLLSCTGCQTSQTLPDQPLPTTPVALSPGDVIKLTFPSASDLNQSQKIRADGKVSLPMIGEVTAAGKKLLDFQNELTGLYKPQLRNSDVVVTLESGTATVIVSGYVTKPAKFTFDRPTTVFQAIMEAGGVSEYGSLSNVHLVRIVNGEQRTQVLNIRSAMSGKTAKVNYIKDGDVIYVAHSLF